MGQTVLQIFIHSVRPAFLAGWTPLLLQRRSDVASRISEVGYQLLVLARFYRIARRYLPLCEEDAWHHSSGLYFNRSVDLTGKHWMQAKVRPTFHCAYYKVLRNVITASLCAAVRATKACLDSSASPPCHRMASSRLRARPSCK